VKKQHLIAVVDDETDIREDYKTLLSDEFDVIDFSDPFSFLKYLDKPNVRHPNLVISDYKMPGMDGIEMIRQAQKKGAEFPFILLSGFLDKDSVITAVEVGVHRLLEKPTNFDQLRAAVDQLLLEFEVVKIRNEIRQITSQLRELYTGIRLILNQHIPSDIVERMVIEAQEGSVRNKMSFESLLEHLESRLERLLESEKIMTQLRSQRTNE
jgi:DNA-binding NtrC family response regulator